MASAGRHEVAAKARRLLAHAKSISETVGLQAAVATTGNAKIAAELKGLTAISIDILNSIGRSEDLGLDSSKWVDVHERTIGNISQILDIASSLPSVHLLPCKLVDAFPGLKQTVSALDYVRRKSLTTDKKDRWRVLWLKKHHEKAVLGEAQKRLEEAEKDLEEYKMVVQRAKRAAAAARDILTLRVTCESRIPKCSTCDTKLSPRTEAQDCCSSCSSIMLSTTTGSCASYGYHEYPNQPTTPPCTRSSRLPNFIRNLPAPTDLDRLDSMSTSNDERSENGDMEFDFSATVSATTTAWGRSTGGGGGSAMNGGDGEHLSGASESGVLVDVGNSALHVPGKGVSPSPKAPKLLTPPGKRYGPFEDASEKCPSQISLSPTMGSGLQVDISEGGTGCSKGVFVQNEEDSSAPCLQTGFHSFHEDDEPDSPMQRQPLEESTASCLASTTQDSMAPSPQTTSREECRILVNAMSSEGEASVNGPLRMSQAESASAISSTSHISQHHSGGEHPSPSGTVREMSQKHISPRQAPRASGSFSMLPSSSGLDVAAPTLEQEPKFDSHTPDAVVLAESGKSVAAPLASERKFIAPASAQASSKIRPPPQLALPSTGSLESKSWSNTRTGGSIPRSPVSATKGGLNPAKNAGSGVRGATIPSNPKGRDRRCASLSPPSSRIKRTSNLPQSGSGGTDSVPSSRNPKEIAPRSPGAVRRQSTIAASPASGSRAKSSGALPGADRLQRGSTIPSSTKSGVKGRTGGGGGALQVQLPATRSPLRSKGVAGQPQGSDQKKCDQPKTGSSGGCPMIRTPPISSVRRVEKAKSPRPEAKKPLTPKAHVPLRQRQPTIVRQPATSKESGTKPNTRAAAVPRSSPPSARKTVEREPQTRVQSSSTPHSRAVKASEQGNKSASASSKQQQSQGHLPFPYIPQLELESQLESIFLGKEAKSAEEPPACVIVSGPRGSGKSMLATHFLNGKPVKQHYDGIFWLNTSDISRGTGEALLLLREFYDLVNNAFGEDTDYALGPSHSVITPGQDFIVFKICNMLKGKRVLLVLDDVVDNHVHLLGVFLKLEVAVLLTTCQEVPDWKVRRFHTLKLPPLSLTDSERLFWKVSRQASKVENSISKEVIQTCGGHPLLTCVAGTLLSRMVQGGKIGILEALCTVHGAVKGGAAADLSAILTACIDEMTSLLDPSDRDLYLMMAVLPFGGFASKDMLQNLWALENVEGVTKKMQMLHSCFLVIPEDFEDENASWGLHNTHMKYVREKVATRKDLQVKMEYRQQRYLCKQSTIRLWFPQKRYDFNRFWRRVGGCSTVERLLKRNMDELKKNYKLAHMLEVFMYDIGANETAERLITLVMLYWTKSLEENDVELAISSTNMGFVRESVGDIEGAEEMHRSALTSWRVVLGNDNVKLSTAMSNLGSVLVSHGGFEEAEQLFRDSLSLLQPACALRHPNALLTMNHLGKLLVDGERLEEAERLFLTMVSIVFEMLGGSHPYGTSVLKVLGLVLNRRGKIVDAEQIYRSALSILVNTFGDMHPEVAMGMSDLGCFLEKRNRLEEAEKLHKIALAILKRVFGVNQPEVAASMCNLGAVYARLHKFEDAEEMNRRALFVMEGLLGNDHPDVIAMRECVSF